MVTSQTNYRMKRFVSFYESLTIRLYLIRDCNFMVGW